MIIIAIIRISGVSYNHKLDITWVFMWQHVEGCIAVTTLSLTAFPSFFTAARREPSNGQPGSFSPRRWFGRRKQISVEELRHEKIAVSPATHTGLETHMSATEAASTANDSDERLLMA